MGLMNVARALFLSVVARGSVVPDRPDGPHALRSYVAVVEETRTVLANSFRNRRPNTSLGVPCHERRQKLFRLGEAGAYHEIFRETTRVIC